jgi:DNA-binding NtrC family response regulator
LAILSPTGCISAAQVEPSITASQPVENQGDAEVSERLCSIERQHIIRIMEESGGNRSEAARRLGIERKTLYKKAERLGIKLRDFDKT